MALFQSEKELFPSEKELLQSEKELFQSEKDKETGTISNFGGVGSSLYTYAPVLSSRWRRPCNIMPERAQALRNQL